MSFDPITFWHWLIFSLLLMIGELFIPGSFLIWLALAAAMVGGVLYLFPSLSFIVCLVLFALLSCISAFLGRKLVTKYSPVSEQPALNRRAHQLIGRTFTLHDPIRNGQGHLKIGDTLWVIEGEDIETGTEVQVVGVKGINLQVEPIKLPLKH